MQMAFCNDKGLAHSEFLSWSAEDRDKAIAYLLEQSLTCQMCGTAPWQWEEDEHAFMAEEHWCKGCYLKKVSSEDAGSLPGTTTVLVPTTAERMSQLAEREKRRARLKRENQLEEAAAKSMRRRKA